MKREMDLLNEIGTIVSILEEDPDFNSSRTLLALRLFLSDTYFRTSSSRLSEDGATSSHKSERKLRSLKSRISKLGISAKV